MHENGVTAIMGTHSPMQTRGINVMRPSLRPEAAHSLRPPRLPSAAPLRGAASPRPAAARNLRAPRASGAAAPTSVGKRAPGGPNPTLAAVALSPKSKCHLVAPSAAEVEASALMRMVDALPAII